MPTKLKIKGGREWQVLRGHPWIFSGAIENAPNDLEAGSLVDLHDNTNRFVARGYYNPKTDIAVRILTRNQVQAIDQAFFEEQIRQALALRQQTLDFDQTNVYRLINAEGDFLPGVIADYYGGYIVLQSHTAGIDQLLEPLTAALQAVIKPQGILLRNDVSVRTREGLVKEEPRLLSGDIPPNLIVQENGYKFEINLWKGQKTGFFTDQRDKRQALQKYTRRLDQAAKLLNVFSYTAGFSVYANPVQTINVDQSALALETARRNFILNGFEADQHQFINTDAFGWLEKCKEKFEVVILDPPAFAKSHRDKAKAIQGYTRLNRLGIPLVKPGGILLTCSCTGAVSLDEFDNCLREASAAAHRSLQILETYENSVDHPVSAATPESRYLKVHFCRVL